MCVKKSAFKKVILSDFFKNTSLSCFVQPSGERQTHFAFFSPLSPSLFPFVQSNSFVMRQFLFPYICACVHSGKKRPHSLAAYCSLLAHTLTIPCERPQGDCPAVHSHIHCALGGNRLAWQPYISLFSMILWDSCGIIEQILHSGCLFPQKYKNGAAGKIPAAPETDKSLKRISVLHGHYRSKCSRPVLHQQAERSR